MEFVSARNFRANQSVILSRALKGEDILLTSRLGTFRITPITQADTLTQRICEGLNEVKAIREGKIKGKSAFDLLDEL